MGSIEPSAKPSFQEALSVWAKIGLMSFGGPAGQIALMHRVLVDERRWIGQDPFLNALNFCMLLPGPEAMQLATYVGWRLHGTVGGLAAGLLFVLPGAFIVLGLTTAYALYGQVPERLSASPRLAGALAGVTAAVVGVILNLSLWFALHVLFGRVDAEWHGPLRLWTPDPSSLNVEVVLLTVLAAVLLLVLRLGIVSTLAIVAAASLVWSFVASGS